MNIRHFDHSHSSVAEVRACTFGNATSTATAVAVEAERTEISEAGQRLARSAGIPLEEIEAGRANWRQPESEYVTGQPQPFYPEAGREQAAREEVARVQANATRRTRSSWTPKTVPTASEKSRSYCRSLAESKEIPSHFQFRVDELLARLDSATQREVSQMIDALKHLPAKATAPAQTSSAAQTDLPDVPAGRYALRTDGVVKFYVLDRPTEGKWAGYTFLKAQASDDKYPIRNLQAKREILTRIAEDVEAAQVLYGQELGRCYACGRTLTDETSRSLGIGPDCRSK